MREPAEPMDEEQFPAGMDLEAEEESPYLRRPRRVEVRRSRWKRLARLKLPALILLVLAVLGLAAWGLAYYGRHSPRFLLRGESIEIQGNHYVTRAQVLDRFAADLGHSVFAVSLAERRAMLEEVAWVERADVARLWPDRIRVLLQERTPVAFVRSSSGLTLVDATGRLLDRPPQANFSFPVVTGVSDEVVPEDRRRRMRLYTALVQDLDRDGNRYSQDLSEVDVSDPEDARVVVQDTAILLHFGTSGFLDRYKIYLSHIQEWQRSIPKIRSVDLRYDRQIVVSPDK